MKRSTLLGLAVAAALSGCAPDEAETAERQEPDWVPKISQVQKELGISDEEVTNAATGWIRFYHAAGDAFEDGTITEEDLVKSFSQSDEVRKALDSCVQMMHRDTNRSPVSITRSRSAAPDA